MVNQKNIDELEKLVQLYAIEFDLMQMNYNYMGLLLDDALVEASVKRYKLTNVYIYGGAYLGLQFYTKLKDKVESVTIVDKSGNSKLSLPGLIVIDIEQLKRRYNGEYIIISLLEYLDIIKSDLRSFVPADKMLLPGEFLGGL